EWVHVQLHQQKGMISLSPPTICNSAEKIKAQIKVSRGGKGISRLIRVLGKNEFIRIVKDSQTVLTIGMDNSIATG
ncbi:hypothetical protein SJ605_25675, partial [Klebsiella pneumoniae]|nr:hypothetical protein [Klebsiella pneumoniae]